MSKVYYIRPTFEDNRFEIYEEGKILRSTLRLSVANLNENNSVIRIENGKEDKLIDAVRTEKSHIFTERTSEPYSLVDYQKSTLSIPTGSYSMTALEGDVVFLHPHKPIANEETVGALHTPHKIFESEASIEDAVILASDDVPFEGIVRILITTYFR